MVVLSGPAKKPRLPMSASEASGATYSISFNLVKICPRWSRKASDTSFLIGQYIWWRGGDQQAGRVATVTKQCHNSK